MEETSQGKLDGIFSFMKMLHAFRNIERVVRANNEERWENDVEHSYHLAMLGWYIVATEKLDLDIDKVLKYALAHDLVEVHAGDTYLFSTDEDFVKSKNAREEAARKKLVEEYPNFPELHEAILAYENKEDAESRFVYALDKLQPVINIYLDGGRTWKEKKVTLKMIEEAKKGKVTISPKIKNYYEELMKIVGSQEKNLVHTEDYEKL